MAVWYIVVDGKETLSSCMTKKEANIFLEKVQNGTMWAYRGNTKKRTKASIRPNQMTTKEKEECGFYGF